MSDLLKSAIADAKAVRATALANAKAALEEAFAPKLQSMLATKLQQEVSDEEGEELPEEPVAAPAEAPVDVAPVDAPVAGEPDGDEAVDIAPAPEAGIEAGLDAGLDSPPVDDGAGMEIAPEIPEAPAEEELPIDGGVEEDAIRGTSAAELDPTMRSLSETDAGNYKKTTTGHKTVDPQGASKELASGPGKADKSGTTGALAGKGGTQKASSNYKTMPKGNAVKNIKSSGTEDPQGASKELASGPGKADKNETGKTLEENEIDDSSLDEILKELEAEVANPSLEQEVAQPVAAPAPQPEMDEEIDLSALLESDDDDKDDEKEEKEDDDSDDKDDEKKKNLPPWLQKENISLKKELQEYRSTVQYLRDRINEVNLLNAKLLYTNKLFKQASLTNEQKLKVIEQFDLTKTVREAKMTYANLAESLSFGVTKKTVTPAPSTKRAGTVRTITEGLASKVIASTKPTKAVITEGAEMANRFKKLAGIRTK